MTFLQTTYSEKRLVRVQEKGQVTLPAEVRANLGLKKGALVAVIETEKGEVQYKQTYEMKFQTLQDAVEECWPSQKN